MADDV
jgi:kinesin family member 18/19